MPMKHIEIEREETRKESWSEEVGREKECYDVTRVHSNTKAGERKKHSLSLSHTHTHTHAAACFTHTTPLHTPSAQNVSTSSLFSLSQQTS